MEACDTLTRKSWHASVEAVANVRGGGRGGLRFLRAALRNDKSFAVGDSRAFASADSSSRTVALFAILAKRGPTETAVSKGARGGVSGAAADERQNAYIQKKGGALRAALRTQQSEIDQAWPLRRSLPGVAPVHLPSSKVSTPFTMIER